MKETEMDAAAIDRLQRHAMRTPPGNAEPPAGRRLEDLVAWNHRCNRLLWDEEDLARRPHVPDAWIVDNKRNIDRYNQRRNDAIEAMDESLLASPHAVPPRPDAWLNSETAGSIVDRLSINLLKRHHMRLQARRAGTTPEHRAGCAAKLARLEAQRKDLLDCLQRLLDGLRDGRCTFRRYRQFKMYNDPALNPHLQAAAPPRRDAGAPRVPPPHGAALAPSEASGA